MTYFGVRQLAAAFAQKSRQSAPLCGAHSKKTLPWLLDLFLVVTLSKAALPETLQPEARAAFEQGISLKPKDQAIDAFQRAIQLDENYVEAHREFQDLAIAKGKASKESVINNYRSKAEAHPQNPAYHYLLGRLLEGGEAFKECQKAAELDPGFFWAHFGLLAYHYSAWNQQAAELEFDKVVQLIPESTYGHVALAQLLFRYQKDKEAIEILERAKVLAGSNPQKYTDISKLLEEIASRNTSNLIAFVSYLIAALICSAFAGWSIKETIDKKVRGPVDLAGLVMLLYSSLWFWTLFVASAKANNVITGIRNPGTVEFIWLLLVAFWPTVTYHTAVVEQSQRVKLHRFYRRMLAYFYLSSIALTLVYSYAVFVLAGRQRQSPDAWIQFGFKVFLINFALYGILSFTMTVKANRLIPALDPESKAARRWELVVLVLFLFIFLPLCISSLFHVMEPGKYLAFVSTLMPLPFIILAFYYEARYAFMDVFIKKSTVIVVMVMTAIAYYLMVVERLAGIGVWKNTRFAELILLLPLIVMVPFLSRVVEQSVDRYVFKRRRNPSEVLSSFSRAIRRIESEEQLMEVAGRYISGVFDSTHVVTGSSTDGSATTTETFLDLAEAVATCKGAFLVNQLPESSSSKRYLVQHGMEVATCWRSRGEVAGYLALGKRRNKEPYLSEDIDLLNSLTDQAEFALETIRLEKKRREQDVKEQELKVLAAKAELRALRAQINPHFLFNALNTIASLTRKDPQKAEQTVETLADVFRHALAKSGNEFVSLAEELEFIQAYLEIEKARFGDKLEIELKIDPQAAAVKIPPMVLQPLVENALKHGIAPKIEGGRITITAQRHDGSLRMEVSDNGVGFDSRNAYRLYRDGVGVKNVRDRLKGIYGTDNCFEIESAVNHGTRILITIPDRPGERFDGNQDDHS